VVVGFVEKLTLNLVYFSKRKGKQKNTHLPIFQKRMEISEISKSGIFCFGWLVVTITTEGLAHFHCVESVQPWHHINPQALRRFKF